jgi:transcriptional regulator with XRE-family HTH domain
VLPEDIRKLRKELECTARELAATIGVDAGEVMAWEQGERFPTKKIVADLERLRERGSGAIVRNKKRKLPTSTRGSERLADPAFWLLVRKLIDNPDLFDKARSLAEAYPDP